MLAVGRFLSKVSQQTDLSTIQQYLAQAENGLPFERVSPAYRTVLIALFASMRVLINILLTNSQNSSVPPSQDPYNKKPKKNASGNKRPRGGQPKHPGHHRKHFEPDRVETLKVDRSQIPPDRVLKELEPEVRQVVNVTMSREVVEYRGEVLQDQYGNIYRAAFPSEARSYFQYGNSVKRYVTNLSTHQLIPYERLAVHMNELFDIPISPATIRNYIRDAAKRLSDFIVWLKTMILMLKIIYVDETGFNVGGKVNWVHIHCDENYTYLYTDEKRGKDATIEIGILPNTSEDTIIVHDCWAPYFHYTCQHALCSAHLLRELQSIIDKQGME